MHPVLLILSLHELGLDEPKNKINCLRNLVEFLGNVEQSWESSPHANIKTFLIATECGNVNWIS